MALEIIWRNPVPPRQSERRIEPIAVDDLGAVYKVRSGNETAAFEVILGGAA
jgi:hypothetical protein